MAYDYCVQIENSLHIAYNLIDIYTELIIMFFNFGYLKLVLNL